VMKSQTMAEVQEALASDKSALAGMAASALGIIAGGVFDPVPEQTLDTITNVCSHDIETNVVPRARL
jgi:hypothetical protein